MMSGEIGTGRTILILAIVVGCFSLLWPKVFYPMLTASLRGELGNPKPEAIPHPHARPERPTHLNPETLHPALREKGRNIPHRTIEKQARPGPMPGMRPPLGAGAHMGTTQSTKGGSGAMGIIMPLYSVGIVIFFLYTIMKVLFKKSEDEEDPTVPKLKDFHMDPEYRKFVFAEEYIDNSNNSQRDFLRRQDRQTSKQRRRCDSAASKETRIGRKECEKKDDEMEQLRERLEETEKAMEKLMSQMGSVTDKLTAAKITEAFSQAQTHTKILKNEEALRKWSSDDTDYVLNSRAGPQEKESNCESDSSGTHQVTSKPQEAPMRKNEKKKRLINTCENEVNQEEKHEKEELREEKREIEVDEKLRENEENEEIQENEKEKDEEWFEDKKNEENEEERYEDEENEGERFNREEDEDEKSYMEDDWSNLVKTNNEGFILDTIRLGPADLVNNSVSGSGQIEEKLTPNFKNATLRTQPQPHHKPTSENLTNTHARTHVQAHARTKKVANFHDESPYTDSTITGPGSVSTSSPKLSNESDRDIWIINSTVRPTDENGPEMQTGNDREIPVFLSTTDLKPICGNDPEISIGNEQEIRMSSSGLSSSKRKKKKRRQKKHN